jgi:hypothetical protein
MTEAEWLAETDFARHLQFVEGRLSPRKSRLLAAALCRLAGPLLDHPDLVRALNEVEWYANGRAGAAELETSRQKCRVLAVQQFELSQRLEEQGGAGGGLGALTRSELAWAVAYAAAVSVTTSDVVKRLSNGVARSLGNGFAAANRDRVRDVVGNPFRPVAFPPDWRTSTVVGVANQIYESRDFSAMPILADALQDAGCDNDEVLNHCRDTKLTHVRGCWVLDGVLGKA